jgi:hypothetical protein
LKKGKVDGTLGPLLKPLTGLLAVKPMPHFISNTCISFSYTSKTMKNVCKAIEMINATCCMQVSMKKVFGQLDLVQFLDKWRRASGKMATARHFCFTQRLRQTCPFNVPFHIARANKAHKQTSNEAKPYEITSLELMDFGFNKF